MNRRLLAIVILVPFFILSAYAVYDVGVVGIFQHVFSNSGGVQVFVDLVIAIVLMFVYIVPEAKRDGRNPWVYLLISAVIGSFGPLLYFLLTPPATSGPNAGLR